MEERVVREAVVDGGREEGLARALEGTTETRR